MTAPPELTAANATHQLICQHVCRWTKTYAMPCHVLKAMPGDRVKVLVFGERHWRGREHIQRVRYVEAGRVRPMTALVERLLLRGHWCRVASIAFVAGSEEWAFRIYRVQPWAWADLQGGAL